MHVFPHALPREHVLQQDLTGPSTPMAREESTDFGRGRTATESEGLSGAPVVTVKVPSRLASIATVPSRSVLYTRAPTEVQSAMTSAAGCPYWLFAPTEMTATCG